MIIFFFCQINKIGTKMLNFNPAFEFSLSVLRECKMFENLLSIYQLITINVSLSVKDFQEVDMVASQVSLALTQLISKKSYLLNELKLCKKKLQMKTSSIIFRYHLFILFFQRHPICQKYWVLG
jgi:hypothetical protein